MDRMGAVWAVLVGATLASWLLGGGHGAVVMAVAFLKVRLVGLSFMELRTAPVPLRALFEGWVVVTGGVLIALYLA